MMQPILLDVHAHLVPVIEEGLDGLGGVSWNVVTGTLTIDGHEIGIKSLYKPAALVSWMEENGVEHAFISPPPPLYRQHLRGRQARAWVNYVNNGLAAIAREHDARMSALTYLPIEDPGLSVEIVHAAVREGKNRFTMSTGTGDERTLGEPEFDTLWAVLDEARAFIFFHPGECADGRLKSFYLTNLLGNPYESTVALAHLLFAGVLERYANIVPCFAHGGGLLPMAAARFQRGFDTGRPGIDRSRASPSSLLGRIFVDCICHGEAAAVAAEGTFGKDKVVFGSDWPFPMGLPQPHEQLASFDADRLARYYQSNPKHLLACIETTGRS